MLALSVARCCTLLVILSSGSYSANILFLFGGGNLSHKISIWPLVTELADRGHNITFVSSSDKQPTKHCKVIDVTPEAWKVYTASAYERDRLQDRIDGTGWDASSGVYEIITYSFCQLTLEAVDSDKNFNNIIRNGQYDLVFISSLFNECGFLLAHHFGAKSIVFDTTMILPWFHGIYGIPIESSWIPHMDAWEKHPMGLLSRMKTVFKYYKGYDRSSSFNNAMENLYKSKFNLENVPRFSDLERNASLVFVNSHHSTDFARSLPPMVVNVGGMQCWEPVGTLPQSFQEYLDDAEHGVILISFGSTIDFSSISKEYRSMFFNAMQRYSHIRFILRWSGEMPDGHPKNVMASKWLPQREILNHPNTIGFMTHCGLNSINEATFHGVPLIAFPLFADQDLSAYRVHAQEIGVRLEAKGLSQEMLDSAIGELTDPKYKKNMKTRSKIFRDRPQSPIQESVYWTEFVLRNDDTSALKPMLLEQSFWTRTSFDVYLAFTAFVVLFPLLLLVFLVHLTKYIYGLL